MGKLFSFYLVIATSAFLVLPTCPCQLLLMFGMDVHGVLNRPQEVSITSKVGGCPIGPCHCEGDVLKSAEVVDPCVDGGVAWMNEDSALPDFGFIDVSPLRARSGQELVHPPPQVDFRAGALERLCVYRL